MSDTRKEAKLWRYDIGGCVGIAACAFLAWTLVARPALSRSAQEAAAAEQLPAKRSAAQLAARGVALTQSSLVGAKRELAQFEQPCWTDLDRNKRVEGLSVIARTAGLSQEIVEPGEAETVAGKRGTPFRFSARGTYSEARSALGQIRRQMPDVVLRSLELRANPGPKGEILMIADLLWVPSSGEPTPGSTLAGGATAAAENGVK